MLKPYFCYVKNATINDIAREAGVSRSLVSAVLTNIQKGRKVYRVGEATNDRILAIMERLDYRPNFSARALRMGDNRTIGVILSDISNRFFALVSRGIVDCAQKHGYTVIFGNTDENPDNLARTIDLFYDKGVKGFIIVPCAGSENIILRYRDKGMAMVLLDRDFDGSLISSVTLDNRKASIQLTGKILEEGHRAVEFVSYAQAPNTIIDREEGYCEEMQRYGLDSFIRIHRPEYGNASQIEKVILDAIGRGVDALVFATYRTALLGRHATIRNNITSPCAFACFNNADTFDIYERGMYYVKQPIEDFARNSVELLIAQLAGGSPICTKTVLPPQIKKTDF